MFIASAWKWCVSYLLTFYWFKQVPWLPSPMMIEWLYLPSGKHDWRAGYNSCGHTMQSTSRGVEIFAVQEVWDEMWKLRKSLKFPEFTYPFDDVSYLELLLNSPSDVSLLSACHPSFLPHLYLSHAMTTQILAIATSQILLKSPTFLSMPYFSDFLPLDFFFQSELCTVARATLLTSHVGYLLT